MIIKFDYSPYSIAKILFLLGVFLKQFYLSTSGGFQLGDLFFMLSSFVMFFLYNRARIPLRNYDTLIVVFVGFVFLVNSLYILRYGSSYPGTKFHMSIIYYIYNLLIVLTFRQMCDEKEFLKHLRHILQAGLMLQLIIAISGYGRYFYSRYMGTFNDPNQCGFYILSSFFLIYLISRMLEDQRV